MAPRGRDDRTVKQMVMDQLVLDRLETWGEWDFLARDVPVERDGFDTSYDVLTVDMENRRIQVDIIGYDNLVKESIKEALEGLENDYGYIAPNMTSEDVFSNDFPPRQVEGDLYWQDGDAWKIDTSEFDDLCDNLFGYDILSRDYERISQNIV